MAIDRTDQGVLMYAEHTGDGGSFLKPEGTAGTVQTLTNANYIYSARTIPVGTGQKLVLTVAGTISAGMASAIVVVEARRADPQNAAAAFNRWAVIGTVRGDSAGSAPASTQTILRAALAGQSVADGVGGGATTEVIGVRLLTTDFAYASEVRVLAKATNAPEANDVVIVAANVGG